MTHGRFVWASGEFPGIDTAEMATDATFAHLHF